MKKNPGRYFALSRGHERSALVKRGHTVIAEVFTDREAGDQYQTAALYAAAPDLLAALQEMLKYAEGFEDADHVIDARAAIARAAISQAQQGQQINEV